MRWYLIVVLICISLMTSWSSFHIPVGHLYVLLWKKMSVQVLCPFKKSSYSVFIFLFLICSVQFSRSVVSHSLRPHGLQHSRPPCPSPTPGVYSNSCSLSQWCHPTISSFVFPFSSCLQSFPASGSLQMSQFFALVAKVWEFQLQHQSFQWTFRTDVL